MDCIKHLNSRKYLSWDDGDELYVDSELDEYGSMFVKITADNYDEAVSQFYETFGTESFPYTKNQYSNEIIFITKPDYESEIRNKLSKFKDCKIKILHILG